MQPTRHSQRGAYRMNYHRHMSGCDEDLYHRPPAPVQILLQAQTRCCCTCPACHVTIHHRKRSCALLVRQRPHVADDESIHPANTLRHVQRRRLITRTHPFTCACSCVGRRRRCRNVRGAAFECGSYCGHVTCAAGTARSVRSFASIFERSTLLAWSRAPLFGK